jgi:hypothetical protein
MGDGVVSDRRPYSRVYWEVRNDPRLADIYCDDHHWAAWNRLLMAADMAWPAPADLPSNARRASIRALEEAGVIELLPGGMYRFHGLDKERDDRSTKARESVMHRYYDRSTDVVRTKYARGLTTSTSRDETRRDETSSTRVGPKDLDWDDGRRDLEAFLLVRHRAPTPAQRDFLDAYQRVFDATGPERAEKLILSHPDDPIGALKADLAAFRKERAEAAAPDEQRENTRSRRAMENTLATNHRNGWHEADPDPRCTLCRSAA